jgi:hypothetical protein
VYYRGAGFDPESLHSLGWPGCRPTSCWPSWPGTGCCTATAHAARGHLADTAGAIAVAACQAAHGVLAARGEWITNDKTLLDRAGLRGMDEILAGLTAEPESLAGAVARAAALVRAPGIPGPGR